MLNSAWLSSGATRALASATIAIGFSAVFAGAALAQQKAPAKAPAKKEATKEQPAAAQSAWVKLCEKAELARRDKDGKEVKEEKNICLTHHERLDGNTGMVLVSAAIRDVEGSNQDHLMIMVPLGMALPPGLKAAVYSKELWEKAQKNEKIDEKQLKPIDLKYTLCHPAGCTAEVEAPKDLVESMKTGGGLMVLAINAGAQPIAFPVPLDGFTAAHAGAPVDNQAYAEAGGQLMQQFRQRQMELAKQQQEKQKQAAPAAPPAKK